MRELNYYVAMLMDSTLEFVKSKVESHAICDMAELISEYDEQDLFEFLKENNCECVEGIHPMDELDDVFDYMSPTEVLEELSDIDLCDDWFNEYSKTSSDDLEDVLDIDAMDIAKDIYNEVIEIDDDDFVDIYEDAQWIIKQLEKKDKKIKTAKALLESAIANDNVDEVINALWNVNA